MRLFAVGWDFTARFESSIILLIHFRGEMLGMFACMNMDTEESPTHNPITNLKEVNILWHTI